MVPPTMSLAVMHGETINNTNTLRVCFKTRENAFSWRESGGKLLTGCDNNKLSNYYCIVFSLETVV
jgi:hypothetical protein